MDEVKRRTHDNYENLYKRMAAGFTKGDQSFKKVWWKSLLSPRWKTPIQ